MSKGNDILRDWHSFYSFFLFKIVPILLVFSLILMGPSLYEKWFVDSKYCLESKDEFINTFEEKINYKIVESIFKDDYTSIFCKDNLITYYIPTCAEYSKGVNPISISSIKVGDTIFKEENKNEFSLVRNGEKITFEIDTKRGIDGSEK